MSFKNYLFIDKQHYEINNKKINTFVIYFNI
jgi:hypothetical protein